MDVLLPIVMTPGTECPHRRFRCLRCANTGCEQPGCPAQAFHVGLCRSCGHIERQQLTLAWPAGPGGAR